MATLASAKKKYEDATDNMPGNYNEKMGKFLGVSASKIGDSGPGQAYEDAIKAPGVADYWEKKLKQAFGV
jgi:hypothetical protein